MKIVDINGRERNCQRVFLDPAWPGYVSVEFVRTSDPTKTRVEWMPLTDFAVKNPNLSDLLKNAAPPPPETTGIVSSAKPDSLSDKIQNWPNNIYAGYHLWISRGKGEGQTRVIMSNTATRLTIDKPWDIKPDKTSQYTVVLHLGSTDQKGNTLPGAVPEN